MKVNAGTHPVASSTPLERPSKTRPLPMFLLNDQSQLFNFKKIEKLNKQVLHPKSPVKSAPPISRVFPHRSWAPEKAHAVSFRAGDEHLIDSSFYSRFYDSERSELYFEQCFIIEKKLGEGSFGEVMQVRSRDDKCQYAVKRSREKFRCISDRKRKLDEVKKHEQLPPHPNCVRFIKAWEEKQRLYIQTELCSMSLQSYLDQHNFLPMSMIWKYFLDLLHGLHHIHSNGFIHFDVKPANIFLTRNGTCKIGDFGLVIDQSSDDVTNAREGDNKYMAPELLIGIFTSKADIFSLGIAMLEVACNLELPTGGLSWQLLRQGFIPPECVHKMPFDFYCIIQWLMTPDHTDRPDIQQVLKHSIIRNHKWQLAPLKVCLYCWDEIQWIFGLLIFLLMATFVEPIKTRMPKVAFFVGTMNRNVVGNEKTWNSSDSTEYSSDGDNTKNFLDQTDEHHCSDLLLTPDVQSASQSHLDPTPRNSSPVAHRAGTVPGHTSPGVSPLTHGRHKKILQNATDDFDFFVSDHSDVEEMDESKKYLPGKLTFSRPRNLIDMLNEVTDSDTSNLD